MWSKGVGDTVGFRILWNLPHSMRLSPRNRVQMRKDSLIDTKEKLSNQVTTQSLVTPLPPNEISGTWGQ